VRRRRPGERQQDQHRDHESRQPRIQCMTPSNFPVRHISIRVPWHDNRWSGTICQHPRDNTACIRLKNISDAKDDDKEERISGKSLKDLTPPEFPPCVKERATFMAPFALERFHEHPYAKTSP